MKMVKLTGAEVPGAVLVNLDTVAMARRNERFEAFGKVIAATILTFELVTGAGGLPAWVSVTETIDEIERLAAG